MKFESYTLSNSNPKSKIQIPADSVEIHENHKNRKHNILYYYLNQKVEYLKTENTTILLQILINPFLSTSLSSLLKILSTICSGSAVCAAPNSSSFSSSNPYPIISLLYLIFVTIAGAGAVTPLYQILLLLFLLHQLLL